MTKITQSEWKEIKSNLERRSREEGIADKSTSVYFKVLPPRHSRRWNLMTFLGLGLVALGILLEILGVR